MDSVSSSQFFSKHQRLSAFREPLTTQAKTQAQTKKHLLSRVAASQPSQKKLKTGTSDEAVEISVETLKEAVKKSDISLIKTALQNPSTDRNALLFFAVKIGNKAVVKILLANGAQIEARDNNGDTPLLCAANYGHKDVVEILLKNKARIEATDRVRGTPLHNAAMCGSKAVVEILLANGAQIEAADKEGGTPLHNAAMCGHKDVVVILLANGAQIEAADKEGGTPLHNAAMCGHKDVVVILLANGARIEATDRVRGTPLHNAAMCGHKAVVAILLANGAQIEAKDKGGDTPSHLAAWNGRKDVLELLLIKNAAAPISLLWVDKSPDLLEVLLGPYRNKDYTHDEYIAFIKHAAKESSKVNFEKITEVLINHGTHFTREIIEELIEIASKNGNSGITLFLEKEELQNYETGYKNNIYNIAKSGKCDTEETEKLWDHYSQKGTLEKMLRYRCAEHFNCFLAAAESGNLPFLEIYYKRVIQGSFGIRTVDQQKRINYTALTLAFIKKKIDVVDWLLKNGADIRYLSRSIDILKTWTKAERAQFEQAKKKPTDALLDEVSV